VLDQHFLKRNRLPRLLHVLGQNPGWFGLGIDEGTAVEVRGRELRVHGTSKAVFVLAPGAGRAQRTVELAAGQVADLPTWQRAARDRTGSQWPPASYGEPRVRNGALVLVGGGRIPKPVIERFVTLAGGPAARIAVVPTAAGPAADDAAMIRDLTLAGAGTVRTFHVRHPREVEGHPDLAFLQAATGVWFGGGRQWRLCDAYENTPALAAMHAVLARGGVIGGTSAGATIQGEFLVRGNPLGNTEMAVEGYDRGFAFLPGCAVDQHFLRRDRTADLAGLIGQHRQLIGLGIDEDTAAVVRSGELEVIGNSQVAVFDARRAPPASSGAVPEPVRLQPGDRWDLVAGTRVGPPGK
jgi:cyanophycinase